MYIIFIASANVFHLSDVNAWNDIYLIFLIAIAQLGFSFCTNAENLGKKLSFRYCRPMFILGVKSKQEKANKRLH